MIWTWTIITWIPSRNMFYMKSLDIYIYSIYAKLAIKAIMLHISFLINFVCIYSTKIFCLKRSSKHLRYWKQVMRASTPTVHPLVGDKPHQREKSAVCAALSAVLNRLHWHALNSVTIYCWLVGMLIPFPASPQGLQDEETFNQEK